MCFPQCAASIICNCKAGGIALFKRANCNPIAFHHPEPDSRGALGVILHYFLQFFDSEVYSDNQ